MNGAQDLSSRVLRSPQPADVVEYVSADVSGGPCGNAGEHGLVASAQQRLDARSRESRRHRAQG